MVGASRDALIDALAAFARGEVGAAAAHRQRRSSSPPRVVFVFPGQGSQWLGMGRGLLAAASAAPVFRAALRDCDALIQEETGFSVLAELAADPTGSRLGEIGIVQPVIFAIQVALAAVWRAWGVTPAAVVGHSMGEVAAAHVAGMLSLRDAVRVICRRSRLLTGQRGKGAMAVVELTMGEAEAALAGFAGRLDVAASNGPRSTVISGDPQAVDELVARLSAQGTFCRPIKVDVASHSPQMDPLLDELGALLADVRPRPGHLALRSTVTGTELAGPELDAAYWVRNLRAPVRFSEAVRALIEREHAIFLELSPHPILLPSIEENLRELGERGRRAGLAAPERGRAGVDAGEPGDGLGARRRGGLRGAVSGRGRVVTLPAYPWQREAYCSTPPPRRCLARGAWGRGRGAVAGAGAGQHPLLGAPIFSSRHPDERLWEQRSIGEAHPWLGEHRLHGEPIVPGARWSRWRWRPARRCLARRGPDRRRSPSPSCAWSGTCRTASTPCRAAGPQ